MRTLLLLQQYNTFPFDPFHPSSLGLLSSGPVRPPGTLGRPRNPITPPTTHPSTTTPSTLFPGVKDPSFSCSRGRPSRASWDLVGDPGTSPGDPTTKGPRPSGPTSVLNRSPPVESVLLPRVTPSRPRTGGKDERREDERDKGRSETKRERDWRRNKEGRTETAERKERETETKEEERETRESKRERTRGLPLNTTDIDDTGRGPICLNERPTIPGPGNGPVDNGTTGSPSCPSSEPTDRPSRPQTPPLLRPRQEVSGSYRVGWQSRTPYPH